MRQHKVFLRHELLKYNSEKSTAKSSALENYISSANLSLSGCSSAEPNSVSVGRCKFQLKKLYLQTVKKVDHLPINFNFGKKAMKKSRFTEPQIIRMLQSQQEGKKVAEICREYGISEQTFYNWKSKYGGMSLSELQRVKELEAENARLKRIVADQQISIDILKEVNSKKW